MLPKQQEKWAPFSTINQMPRYQKHTADVENLGNLIPTEIQIPIEE